MAVGEVIRVSSQRDSEQAAIDKERVEQAKGVRPLASHAIIMQCWRHDHASLAKGEGQQRLCTLFDH